MTLQNVSTYFLLLELFEDGKSGLHPELEPIDLASIRGELKRRSGGAAASTNDDWAKWFLGAKEHGSELERANFLIYLRTKQSMERVWAQVRNADRS